MHVHVCVCVSCSVVSDSLLPLGYSLPGSSVHGIFQARVLEWVAISFSRRSSQLRDWTWVSCIAGWFFTVWVTREVTSNEYNLREWRPHTSWAKQLIRPRDGIPDTDLGTWRCYWRHWLSCTSEECSYLDGWADLLLPEQPPVPRNPSVGEGRMDRRWRSSPHKCEGYHPWKQVTPSCLRRSQSQ